MNMAVRSPTVFLDRALAPIRPWLLDDQVVEICANGPGDWSGSNGSGRPRWSGTRCPS